MKKVRNILILLLAFGGTYIQAQSTERSLSELKSALEKLNNTYLKMGPIQSEVSYFSSESGDKAVLKKAATITYITDRSRNYIKQEEIEVIKNGSYNVMLDHERKLVVVEKNLMKPLEKIPFGMLDSMLALCKKTYMLSAENSETWIMDFENIPVKRLEIVIDPLTFKIKSITTELQPTYDYPKGQLLRMVVESRNIDKKTSEAFLDEKKIVQIDKKGKVVLTEKYKHYHLLTPQIQL